MPLPVPSADGLAKEPHAGCPYAGEGFSPFLMVVEKMSSSTSSQWDAELYDSKHAFVWERAAEVLSLLGASLGEAILDLGCGTGHLTSRIASSGARVVGIDSSPEMIEEARKNYPELTFSVADAREFDLGEAFDGVFSNAVLHWVKEADRVIQSVWNALKPGGRFVAEFGGKGNVRKLVDGFYRALEKMGAASDGRPNPWYFPSVGEYSVLLEKHGFDVTFAKLFERFTALEDGERGLRNWIRMFGGVFCSALSQEKQEQFIQESEDVLRPALYRDGAWFLDYRRLQVVARKP
jgi:trans-aconitate methyltransferase